MSKTLKDQKEEILAAGEATVDELIKILKAKISVSAAMDDIAADKMKNAASAKKLAFMDALEINDRIRKERDIAEGKSTEIQKAKPGGFAEKHAEKAK